ncbi:MAG: protocatechuate 3,4-dioxygenase, beta subunit [Chitinophagaceae bacterium]|nr:protocatechuate 3,4-dioxygenase, beta subunit [Chitinophagaceae bacterium]
MKHLIFAVLIQVSIILPSCSQITRTKVGGPCEGCEAIYESATPFNKLSNLLWMPDWNEAGPRIAVSGIVYKSDGKTPAADVVLYIYHTDQTGHYTAKGNEKGWGKRHGYIRGWLRTNEKGEYKFFTLKPAPYPGGKNPAHIHITVKEPGLNEYYIDEFLFSDDAILSNDEKKKLEQRGGNGIISLQKAGAMFKGERNIYLGKKIPGYPFAPSAKISSGLNIGSNCPAFGPMHVSGADKGDHACPMCKYGSGQGIMVWWNDADINGMLKLAKKLDKSIGQKGLKKLRAFIVFMNPLHRPLNEIRNELTAWANHMRISDAAIVFVPSPDDAETAVNYKINPLAKNTVFVYKQRKVVSKFINYRDNDKNYSDLLGELN